MIHAGAIPIYKAEGETPLEALEAFRRAEGIERSVPMTYAGRLDPMAEGLLLILVGEECKRKDAYLGLDKEYEVDILLGLGSDTGDILGVVRDRQSEEVSCSDEMIREAARSLKGKRKEKYPAYSSRTVGGEPLFAHAKRGNIGYIDIPEKDIEIYSVELMGVREISRNEAASIAIERIKKVKGDFRQKEAISSWERASDMPRSLMLVTVKIASSSGAYMRTLAERYGSSLGTDALAWRIRRTRIGGRSL